jgi:heme-degrading monooxygenase HmoA
VWVYTKRGCREVIEIHVYCEVLEGKEQELKEVFDNVFSPAMAKQLGFVRVNLLKMREDERKYEIDIVFETEEQRLAWVATPEHAEAWPKVEACFSNFSYKRFDVVALR